MVTDL